MQYNQTVKRRNLYRRVAKILNGLLELPPREMEIFSILLRLDNEWKPVLETEVKDVLTAASRKAIMRDTLINKNNLSKYISDLKSKRLIVKNEQGGYEVNKLFPITINDNIVNISFNIHIEDETN